MLKYPEHILKTHYNDVEKLDDVVGTSIREVKLRHLLRLVDVIDNTQSGPEWHKKWEEENVNISPKIDKSTIARFDLEHDNLFSFKVHPKTIEKVINNSSQKDSIVAIAATTEMRMIDVVIQPPKEDMKLNPRMMLAVDKSTDGKPYK